MKMLPLVGKPQTESGIQRIAPLINIVQLAARMRPATSTCIKSAP